MVKRNVQVSLSEDHSEVEVLNENGKRWAQDQTKDGTKKLKTKSWFRQPTANELNRLQETENLFNSNLFRLQVDEILEEVKLKEKTEKKFTEWFTAFKIHLLGIPEDGTEYDLSEQAFTKKIKVKLPVTSKLNKTRCSFKFHKFKDVEIVGSYSLGCVINSKLKVDVQITVPAETYTKNDSINYRYHKKRAAYLAYIASYLLKLDSIEELKYSWQNGCETKPVLDINPSGKLGNHLSVRLNLVCEPEAYKHHRFSTERNNLREAWLLSSEVDNVVSNEVGPPTPFYNSSILSDLTASANQEYLKEILSKGDNLKQAVVLLKIWLRQRNLQVSGHVVSSLVAYFVQNKRINNIMSSYQIVRNIWIALKSLELDTKGISLNKTQPIPIENFHQHFPVVFLDCTGTYNLCWDMCKGTYMALRRECELAVEILDNGKINSFIPLFMTLVKPLHQFDHILKFKDYPTLKATVISKASTPTKVNYGVNELALVTDTLHQLISKGLGKRADLILQLVEADFSWPVKKTPEKVKAEGYEEKLSFGIILNPEHSVNTVDKGPPANLPEAEEFRAFWGDKSELRRFQDGSITETCVWGGDSAAERRRLTSVILDYLLHLKYGISPSDLFHYSNQLDSLTARKQFMKTSLLYVEETSLEVLQAFDALRRDLRQLTELPLDISAVYGTSPVFSYCDPLPALPAPAPRAPWRRGSTAAIKDFKKDEHVVPHYTPVASAVIELGHSGKWPGDIQAFRCLKAAFHSQIADRLTKQYSIHAQAYPTHIDVLKNGLVFRLSIAHPKEITLLRKEVEGGVAKYRETEESVELQCATVLLPKLRGALHGLHQAHQAFGPTVCLFKRWLSCHLLGGQFPGLLAELVAAAVFARAAPLAAPASATAGLLRVLGYLAAADWATEVVVLDFNEDMTREEISALESELAASPERPALCITTSYDGRLGAVVARGLGAAALARARALAATALAHVEGRVHACSDHFLGAFVPSLSGYDVLIHLKPHLVPYVSERPDKKPELRPLPDKMAEDIVPIVEFNPVRNYLEDLRSAYSDFALFFHDQYGGEVIAVLWKPDVEEFKDFQLLSANALAPVTVKGETKYKVNKDAIVEDFRILGEGLVKDITVS